MSGYMEQYDVGYDWAINFEFGRYVTVVYQRFSVFENSNEGSISEKKKIHKEFLTGHRLNDLQ